MADQFFERQPGRVRQPICLEWDGMDVDVAMGGAGIMPGYFIG